VERWGNGGELGTAVFTVPTAAREWDVDLWVAGVESLTRWWIGAGLARGGFAVWLVCPQFAQGSKEWWKNRDQGSGTGE
jgi:hypothetical protein